ncbi:MAG: hypothetical protein LBD97_06470 [Bifidobacteriaceae bacterium]|nr:hypothetical protein [Bifidobacteriaceae bacterium]
MPYKMERVGLLMSPEPGNPLESEGVLNPATAWGRDGNLYLYPRLVAQGNVSRIGRARVVIEDGRPVGVEREGLALEPIRGWEHGTAHGGVEDPRVSHLASLGVHVMAYVAYGPLGPKPALALSNDGRDWRRLGPITFEYDDELDTDLNMFPNKDVALFPEVVPSPDGRPSYAILHRPMWDLSFARAGEAPPLPLGVEDRRPGIWISYVDQADAVRDLRALTRPHSHRPLATPEHAWEDLKIGGGAPPLRVPEGWLLLYHGVDGQINDLGSFVPQDSVRYVAAAMLLDPDNPARVLARSAAPLLEPSLEAETIGQVCNVVFPTAVEAIEGNWFVFYGMADSQIGVARLERDGAIPCGAPGAAAPDS